MDEKKVYRIIPNLKGHEVLTGIKGLDLIPSPVAVHIPSRVNLSIILHRILLNLWINTLLKRPFTLSLSLAPRPTIHPSKAHGRYISQHSFSSQY